MALDLFWSSSIVDLSLAQVIHGRDSLSRHPAVLLIGFTDVAHTFACAYSVSATTKRLKELSTYITNVDTTRIYCSWLILVHCLIPFSILLTICLRFWRTTSWSCCLCYLSRVSIILKAKTRRTAFFSASICSKRACICCNSSSTFVSSSILGDCSLFSAIVYRDYVLFV